ncbi:hypothetical protein C0989_002334 [Termitomyces sp. Mn162]|nr:hypothetical protein C0989_002334 [Termitomyces sp. Mn162]
MQPDWDAVDEDDGDDGMRSGPSPQQVRISIQDVLATMFAIQSAGGPQSSDHGGSRNTGISGFNLQDISRWFIGRGGATRGLALNDPDADGEEDDYDDEDDDDDYHALFNTSSRTSWKGPETTEPQKEGVELLNSGDFGRVGNKAQKRRNKTNIANIILNRTRRIRPVSNKEDYAALLASTTSTRDNTLQILPSIILALKHLDFRLHVFDTTKPPIRHGTARLQSYPGLQTNMKVRKCIQGHLGQWTITDANLSPDNERMIYSSITPTVYMTNILDDSQVQTPIPFSDPRASNRRALIHDESFGIWSCRFSADGNEVVAGGSKKIFVYDLLANRRTVKINAHTDDVNSCCWADTASGNVLVSASDDTFIKVWDRRSLGASQKPSGILIGHTEGLTYVSAKGDGRYIVSNGKDQAMRLWDLRKMRSNQDFDAVRGTNYGLDFDYRYPPYPGPRVAKHPKDCSVMTYYGHSVMRTLIRCHFSPTETTGAQYLYSGSADGRIHVWIDLVVGWESCAARVTFDKVKEQGTEPVMMSAAWENSMNGSTVARHEWKGLLRMHGALEDWVEKNTLEGEESSRRRSVRLRNQRRVPGAFEEGENAEDTE